MLENGQPEAQAVELKRLYSRTNGKGIQILLHPKAK